MQIEDGIPLPPPRNKTARTEAGRMARQLKVGQSLLVDTESDMECARHAVRACGGKAETRKTDGGWRVWRTA